MKYLLGEKLNFDWKVVTVTIVSTLLLMIDHYHKFTAYKYLDRVILYLVIPLLIIIILFRENPKDYGFSFGDWKLGLIYTALGILCLAPIIYFLGSGDASMKTYYEKFLPGLPWTTFLDLIGWEFFFRGLILFAYARRFGHEALWLQAVPFAIAHISKPEIETLSTIFGGFAFGWVAYRTKSFVWPFLIHWFIATFIIIVAGGVI
ncbi:MAG TPA: CPBP family intramembrane glutamic endopeptidase [Anaerolineales bacterium]|nr:CPBP family intramembrane glutamic endopeptidase [Anaerolineales bacterium]